jgi:hypothetical protein
MKGNMQGKGEKERVQKFFSHVGKECLTLTEAVKHFCALPPSLMLLQHSTQNHKMINNHTIKKAIKTGIKDNFLFLYLYFEYSNMLLSSLMHESA